LKSLKVSPLFKKGFTFKQNDIRVSSYVQGDSSRDD
jgi:hypothetical protein